MGFRRRTVEHLGAVSPGCRRLYLQQSLSCIRHSAVYPPQEWTVALLRWSAVSRGDAAAIGQVSRELVVAMRGPVV